MTITAPNQQPFTCRLALIACTCDLPAKAQVLNVQQFNAYYGCSFCLQRGLLSTHCRRHLPHCMYIGTSVSTGKGHVHCYPYNEEDPSGPLRTSMEFMQHAQSSYVSESPVQS